MYTNNLAFRGKGLQCNNTSFENDTLLDVFILQRYTDCSFEVGFDDDKEVIGAHKAALAARSPMFKAMFFGPVYDPKGDKNIIVPDIKPSTFRDLLKYIYGGEQHLPAIPSFDQLSHLYCAAHKYLIPFLVQWCSSRLSSVIDAPNACQAYELGKIYDDELILSHSLMTIQKKTPNVLIHPSFVNISFYTLVHILDMEPLFIASETVLHDALLKWMRNYCERNSVDLSDKGVKKMIGTALSKLDFTFMTAAELSSISESPFFVKEKIDGQFNSLSAMPLKVPQSRASRRVHVPLDIWSKSNEYFQALPSLLMEESGLIQIDKGTSHTIKFVSNCDLKIRQLNIWHQKRSDDIDSCDDEYYEYMEVFVDDSNGKNLATQEMRHWCCEERTGLLEINEGCEIKKNQVYSITVKYNIKGNYPRITSRTQDYHAFFTEIYCESVTFRLEWKPESFCFIDSIAFSIADK